MALSDAQRAALARRGRSIWRAVCAVYSPDAEAELIAGLDAAGLPDAYRLCDDASWEAALRGDPPSFWPLVRTLVRSQFEPIQHLDLSRITRLEQVQARGEPVDHALLDLHWSDVQAFPALRELVPGGNDIDLREAPVLAGLELLDLRGMEVRGFEALAAWADLRQLAAHPQQALPALPQVTVFDARDADALDLSHLVGLSGVEVLRLQEIGEVEHVEALAELPRLRLVLASETDIDWVPDGVELRD